MKPGPWKILPLFAVMIGTFSGFGQAGQALFTDSLQNGWEDWSWCTRSLTNTSPVHLGTRSISASATAYQSLRFYHPPFSTAGYTNFVFWAHGGSTGGQNLRVHAETNGVSLTSTVWTGPLTAGIWQRIEVPLSSLGVANVPNLTGLYLYNYSGSPMPTLYLDDLSLEAIQEPPGTNLSMEAESGTLVGTYVTTAVSGYSGTGYVAGFDASGDLVRWTFSATNGLYRLLVRFRSPYGQKGFDAVLNGKAASNMFPQTGKYG